MEQTQRGKQERKDEEQVMQGEPAKTGPADTATVTRDKGADPVVDERRDGRGEGK